MINSDRLRKLHELDQDDPPRVNIELLTEVWDRIQAGVVDELLTEFPGDVVVRFNHSTSLDGWHQGAWRTAIQRVEGERCQTAMCLAGHVVDLDEASEWLAPHQAVIRVGELRLAQSGSLDGMYPLRLTEEQDQRNWLELRTAERFAELVKPREDLPHESVSITDVHDLTSDSEVEVQGVFASVRAQSLLGIDSQEANNLFVGTNALSDLAYKIAEVVFAERVRRERRATLKRLMAQEEEQENS